MKILPIKSPNFGYNVEYHNYLQQSLANAKHDKELAKFLIASDKLSLNIEDEIISMEKTAKKRNTERFGNLTKYLVDLKNTMAFYLVLCFDKLQYPENEVVNYMEEASGVDDEKAKWRADIAKTLESYITVPVSQPETKAEENSTNITKEQALKTLEEVGKQAVDDYKAKAEKELLEHFVSGPESPHGFSDVMGIDDIKLKLTENILEYALNPEQAKKDYEDYGISAPHGFLFYGPPGCGKTYITQALAVESGLDMYKLDVSKAGSRYVNQTPKNLQKAFDVLKEKTEKDGKPVILFMDEVDSLAMSRGDLMANEENMKTVTTLLKLIEGARDNNIIVIAATNKYDLLDEAFKARFDGQVYFPLPNEKEIASLLKHLLSSRKKGVELSNNNEEIETLSKLLKGYSNRSITFIVEEASKTARRRNRDNIIFDDVKCAIETSELEKSKEKDYKKSSKARVVGFGK